MIILKFIKIIFERYKAHDDERNQRSQQQVINRNRSWEVNTLKYREARNNGRHLSYAFYLTLGFFITITGGYFWFIVNLGSIKLLLFPILTNSDITKYFGATIGIILLLMLINLAKVSRISADNQELIDNYEGAYPSQINYRGSGFLGVGDFIHYLILTAITCFFIIYPFHLGRLFETWFLCIFFVLFILIYYGLARGDFIIGKKNAIRSKLLQAFIYSLIFLSIFIYISMILLGIKSINNIYGLAPITIGIIILGLPRGRERYVTENELEQNRRIIYELIYIYLGRFLVVAGILYLVILKIFQL